MLERQTRLSLARSAELLAEATRLFTEASTSTSGVVDKLVEAAIEGIGDVCAVHLLNEDGGSMRAVALGHGDPAADALLKRLFGEHPDWAAAGIASDVLVRGEPVLTNDLDEAALASAIGEHYREYIDRFGMSAMILMPLRTAGEVFGLMSVARDRGGMPYEADDVRFVQELADRAAIAIQNARLYERLESVARRHAEAESRLMVLVEAASQLIESQELSEILPRILRLSARLIDADAHALWNFDAEKGVWDMPSSEGLSAEYLANATIAVTAQTPQLDRPLVVPDVYDSEILEGRREGYGPEGIKSIMVTPLRIGGKTHGTLTFYYRKPHRASAVDVQIAEALASLASAAIHSSRTHTAARIANQDLGDANRRLALLSEASAVLSSAFDLASVTAEHASASALGSLARMMVPAVADVCVIDVFETKDRTQRVEAAAKEGIDLGRLARIHLRDWRVAPNSDVRVSQAIYRGESFVVADVTDEWLAACAPDATQLELARGMGAGSIIMAPMRARGETIGTFTAATVSADRTRGPNDVQLVEEVARRAAIALDNARLFVAAQETALELRAANAAKDEFLGLVSHELKTPITTILGNAEVMARRYGDLDEASRQGALADIRSEAERLHRIIDNLLVLARLEQGSQLDREPMLVRRIVAQVVTAHLRNFPERDVRMEWEIEPTPVLGSAHYLEQTLRNLLSNAEKYSPPDRPIRVLVSKPDDELVVRVLDEGPGVKDDEVEALFTPFYRSEATARLAHGVGIGLAVCKRLIEAQGGHIWAARRPEGGSEFGFALPLADED